MKCLHCGINYDDEDRECPICGTKKGTGHRATVPRYTSSTHTMHDEDACTHRTFTKEIRSKTPTPQSYPRAVKKRGSAAIAVIVAVVVFNLLPALVTTVKNASPSVSWAVPAPVPAPEYDSTLLEVAAVDLLGAQVRGDAVDGVLTLDFAEDGMYLITRTGADWKYTEQGWSFCSYNEPERDDIFYSTSYPSERYEGYLVALYADEGFGVEGPAPEELAEGPAENERWLVAYVERETGALTLHDWDGTSGALLGGETLEISRVQIG